MAPNYYLGISTHKRLDPVQLEVEKYKFQLYERGKKPEYFISSKSEFNWHLEAHKPNDRHNSKYSSMTNQVILFVLLQCMKS